MNPFRERGLAGFAGRDRKEPASAAFSRNDTRRQDRRSRPALAAPRH